MRLRAAASLAAGAAIAAMLVVSCTPERATAPRYTPNFSGLGSLPSVRFSELHYDNVGTDVNEAIEISGPAGTDMTGWSVLLYNGSGGAVYDTKVLTGAIPATCGTRGVMVINYPANGIQNGSPDGMALVDAGNNVIQFLSYEGTFTGVGGPANGMLSVDIGALENGSPLGQSLQLDTTGTWVLVANTFGACNDNGSGATPPPPVVTTVVVTPATTSVSQGGQVTFTAQAFDQSTPPQPISGVTFTWLSDNTAAATVSTSGVATGVAPGSAHLIATAPNAVAGQATLTVNPPSALPDTRFSEIHYDNTGTDANEAIEIEGSAGTDVTGWSIVLYNGNGGNAYDTKVLSGTIPATCTARGVVVQTYPSNGIQNGSPDGMALVDAQGNVIEFLSYEGTFTATDGPAVGLASTDIVAFENSAPIGISIQRDAFNNWALGQNTFGACNATGSPPPTGTTVSVTMNLPRQAPQGFVKPAFATVRDPNGVVITPALTWTSSDPAIATVDADGYVTAVASSGTVSIRATEPGGAFGETTFDALPTTVPTGAIYHTHTMFGVPADADPSDDIMISRPQYTLSYNAARGGPNWVAFNINATTFGASPRCDCFSPDPLLSGSTYHVVDINYRNGGYDRGHMTQSEVRTDTYQENATTFYLTNVLPQGAENNQGPWSKLENDLNDMVRLNGKEVWVYAGGVFASNPGSLKNEGHVLIPDYTWKVAVVLSAGQTLADVHSIHDLQVIAVQMPNLTTTGGPNSSVGIRNNPWQNYVTTVDAIEAEIGYDLLSALPDNIENPVEANDHAPVANAGGAYAGVEGSAVAFNGGASSDPDAGDLLTYAWDFGDGSTGTGATPAHAYADNGSYTVSLTVTDNYGLSASATSTATIANANPVLTALTVSPVPRQVGAPLTVSASFTDAGINDTHQTVFDWGDGTVSVVPGELSVSASHAWAAAGLYVVTATVTDKDGGSVGLSAARYVPVFDPDAGFTWADARWLDGTESAHLVDDVRYNGAQITGYVNFTSGDRSISVTNGRPGWMVVSGNKAIISGTTTLAGRTGNFSFLVVTVDNGGTSDGARIRITENATGIVVYDNQPGQPDNSSAVTTVKGFATIRH